MKPPKWVKKRKNKSIRIQKSRNFVETSEAKLLKKVKIKVIDNLLEMVIDNYRAINPGNNLCDSTDKEVIKRLCLNYVRHNLSNYDILIARTNSIPYSEEVFKFKFNEKILEKYVGII